MIDNFSDTATSNYPFPSPTAPAPGPNLLDDNESKFLDSFFDGVSSDHFNYDFFNNAPDGTEQGLGWEELPPAFMGTSSSFGAQQQFGSHGLLDPKFAGVHAQLNAGPSIPASTSADVLAAASVLQNGPTGRAHSVSDGLFHGHGLHPSGPSRTQSLSLHQSRIPTGYSLRPSDEEMRDNTYTEMIFGGQPNGGSMREQLTSRADVRWGTDVGFSTPQGFNPPPSQDVTAAPESQYKQRIDTAVTITHNGPSSAGITIPSSPAQQRRMSVVADGDRDDYDSRPSKRRKSKLKEEAEDEDDAPYSSKTAKKRKPGKKSSNDSPAPESEQSSKRQKSLAAAAAKASRENLTEDQKRENHIRSEQKRRTLIREGFEDLGELVPGLRGGGFSKSAVLIMSADWLEDLIQGNQVLQSRLDQMEGR